MSSMLDEIREQPTTVAATLDAALEQLPALRRLGRDRRHVAFVARGSSDNAAIYGRYLCELHAGRAGRLMSPSVATRYRRTLELDDTLVVALSQSGGTEEIVETAIWARTCGARVVAITNNGRSALAEAADLVIVTRAGRERAIPATKTYTAQLAALAVLGLALGTGRSELLDCLERVPGEIARLLHVEPWPAQVPDPIFAIGRGYTLSTAAEVALKLLETCCVPTLGLSYADLLHGPIAAALPGRAAIVAAPPDGPVLDGCTAVAERLRARGAVVVGLGGDVRFASACEYALGGPGLPEALAPLALVVPGQLLVESLARQRGFDPDRPAGLSKVTQTDGLGAARRPTERNG
jgi:glucosamine--fructose-6-phosphate aminotransferase (isomerizing)